MVSAGTIFRVKFFEKFCGGVVPSTTLIVNVKVPAVVGVPLSAPPLDSDSPAGSGPVPGRTTDHP
jgi:hypothetical protein